MSEKYENTTGCESNAELNGKDASFRTAKMISDTRVVKKVRIKGALVPLPKDQQ